MRCLGSLACVAWLAGCAATTPDRVRARLAETMPGTPVDEVRPSPVPGLYEVRSGREIFYTTRGRYLIVGHVFDPVSGEDLTARRLDELDRVAFSELPLDLAVVTGADDAQARVAVFDDPDCPFCRRLERMLDGMRGVRVYRFLYPLEAIHPRARRHAAAIWCAKDRVAALRAVMIEGRDLAPPAGCRFPADRIEALARRIGVVGTPTLIAEDGRVLRGLPRSADALEAWLEGRR